MSDFERLAVQRLIDKATAAGLYIPDTITAIASSLAHTEHCGSYPAGAWADANPGDDYPVGCCIGNDMYGPDRCTCWTAVYEIDQHEPRPPQRAEDIEVQTRMCGDCAFRKGSPERAEGFLEEALHSMAEAGQPFYCHDGMRRPAHWLHPDGRRVEGSTADWRPPIIAGLPYRADGRPGLLCAGWMARASRAATDGRPP